MKKATIVLSLLMVLFLTASVIPPASVDASLDDTHLTITDSSKSKSKPVLIKIKNRTNQYVTVTLDHRQEYHFYTFSVPPGANQYWIYSGQYNYNYTVCDKPVGGHKNFNKGDTLTIAPCPQTITESSKSKSKPVMIKIKNKTNRYITVTLDNRQEYHLYTFSVPPGANQYWIYSGQYNYNYTACDKSVGGHKNFKKGDTLTITCPRDQ